MKVHKPQARRTSNRRTAGRKWNNPGDVVLAPNRWPDRTQADPEPCFLPLFLLWGLGSTARAAGRRGGYAGADPRGGGYGGFPWNGAWGFRGGTGGFAGPGAGMGGGFPFGGGYFGGPGGYFGGGMGRPGWPFGGRSFLF